MTGHRATIARVVGTRPQFMQVPVVLNKLVSAGYRHVLIHTGQHYDDAMSDSFFRDLGLPPPDINLGVGGLSQGAATGMMMQRIETCLSDNRPDAVLVDGDTNSTMAAALAAVKMHIPVFHIEAGLRDFDRRRPEEINRIVTDHVSTLNFSPIPRATENLRTEGRADSTRECGDVLLDCFLRYRDRAIDTARKSAGVAPGGYHVMTLHRPENTDLSETGRFRQIMAALGGLDKPVVFPVHPRTRPILRAFQLDGGNLGPVRPVEPVGYLEMLDLVGECDMVFTDSGGLPREAAWAGKRVVMLFRMDTWHDLLENDWAQIGKTDAGSIVAAADRARPAPPSVIDYFGAGAASTRIVAAIDDYFR